MIELKILILILPKLNLKMTEYFIKLLSKIISDVL